MDSLPFLALAGAAVGGAVVGALACWWPLSRRLVELRNRLAQSEQVRAGAVDRSAKAREQIAQLNRAIAELRRSHSPPSTAPSNASSSRDAIEKALAEGDKKARELTQPGGRPAFADTEVMNKDI